jgi:uncharacterized protein (DUF697 family)
MDLYKEKITSEITKWEKDLLKKPPIYSKAAKSLQLKINQKIPQRFHDIVTTSFKGMVKTVITGSDWLDRTAVKTGSSLKECDDLLEQKVKQYKKIALVEGAATGAGGFMLSVADLPLLLSIKIKFLYDVAGCYGYDIRKLEERVFILYIFTLVFSDYKNRKEIFPIIKNWEVEYKDNFTSNQEAFDWQGFQQNYRDYIDLAKLLQLIPGFGAIVGGYANYNFVKELGETAKNCFRLRIIHNKS